jgi:hypothetical protein
METNSVIIHVRFSPNGTVVEIGERPGVVNPQQWFDYLSEKIGGTAYQALSGGRGVFRSTRDVVDALKVESAACAA